jgi:site-specific DNA-methyltransferase (cytosine-N4-specific)
MFLGKCEDLLKDAPLRDLQGQVQLILTSPPFPLNRKKKYGNLRGDEYLQWLASMAPLLRKLLTKDGSIVLELGNAWEAGSPTMSTLPIESLLRFKRAGKFHLCQEFIAFNTARLPSPAQWVNVERIRVKDAFTRFWWMSKTVKPKANNRKVLAAYSGAMQKLLQRGTYNSGLRPSEFVIGEHSFLRDNGGSVVPNVLVPSVSDAVVEAKMADALSSAMAQMLPEDHYLLPQANSSSMDPYLEYCRANGVRLHPARMSTNLASFFVQFLTDEGDLVLDPFAGSNVTGYVAEQLERQWLATEADEVYARASESRFVAGKKTCDAKGVSTSASGHQLELGVNKRVVDN